MTSVELQKYLAGVLETELTIYTQNNLIDKLTSKYNGLNRKQTISKPQKRKTEASLLYCVWVAGIISGIIGGIVGLIDGFSSADSFIYYIAAIIAALIYAVVSLLVGGIVFGFIAWIIWLFIEKKRIDEEYDAQNKQYNNNVVNQNSRLKREQQLQPVLAREINSLKVCRDKSIKNLSEMYSYNIIAPEYRNIFAVSSFLGYLRSGRTYCLNYDQLTGDQGAYNIYEMEVRLDKIITNTEEILYNLDMVLDYQRELAYGLQQANKKIDNLYSDVTGISRSVKSIEQSQSIIEYNSECTKNQVALLTWMHCIY